jgi:hypothetical protein
MATLRMASLWKDPRTGILVLRKRIPTRYRAVSGRQGDTVKMSTGTADRRTAEKLLPELLRQWTEMEAGWERRLNGDARDRSSGRTPDEPGGARTGRGLGPVVN